MKRITRLSLRNFKAFRDQEFVFDGKNVLIHGNNGSGKSSLYWALYTFLQSSVKDEADVRRYFQPFDPTNPDTFRSLKNVFADEAEDTFIELTWREGDTGPETTQIISNTVVNTRDNTVIAEANLASDFINYKLLQNFYNVTHKEETNLWEVFMRDVFPYFSEQSYDPISRQIISISYRQLLEELVKDLPRNKAGSISTSISKNREQYNEKISKINNLISQFLGSIENTANETLKDHFYGGQELMRIHLDYDERPHIGTTGYKLYYDDLEQIIQTYRTVEDRLRNLPTKIKLWVEIFDRERSEWIANHRPHSFLNEALLTRIAFAVRIGALRTRVQESDFKVLCLDDMLISLDMSNRMQLVKLILNQENKSSLRYFESYQRIILTHSKGFYNAIKRYTAPQDWKYYEIRTSEAFGQPTVQPGLTSLERAINLHKAGDYEGCGLQLRQEIESIAKEYLDKPIEEEETHQALGDLLASMREKSCANERQQFDRLFLEKERILTIDQIKMIDIDFENDSTLDGTTKAKLKSLKRSLNGYLIRQYEIKESATQLMAKTKFVVDFYLNQQAHSTTHPTIEEEVNEALDVVKRLRKFLDDKKG